MKPHRISGFTLIEIIVVVLVFSVMSAMAYGGLNSVLRTRRDIEDSMKRTAAMQRAFLRLRGDFQNVRDRAVRDNFGDEQPAFSFSRDGALSLVRGGWRTPMQTSRSSMERVSYELKEGTLRRASYGVLDLPQELEPVDLALLPKVEEVRWRFMDGVREWQTQWPADDLGTSGAAGSAAGPPPIAVELTLVTKDWGEMIFLFRTPMAGLVAGTDSSDDGGSSSGGFRTSGGLFPGSLLGAGLGARGPVDPDGNGEEVPSDPDGEITPGDNPDPGDDTNPGNGGLNPGGFNPGGVPGGDDGEGS